MTRLPGTHWYIRNDTHIARENKRIVVGQRHTLDNYRPLILCSNGYHASRKLRDALYYGYRHASGRFYNTFYIYRVTLSKERDYDNYKVVARWRKYVAKAGPFSHKEMDELYYNNRSSEKYKKLLAKLYSQLRNKGGKK